MAVGLAIIFGWFGVHKFYSGRRSTASPSRSRTPPAASRRTPPSAAVRRWRPAGSQRRARGRVSSRAAADVSGVAVRPPGAVGGGRTRRVMSASPSYGVESASTVESVSPRARRASLRRGRGMPRGPRGRRARRRASPRRRRGRRPRTRPRPRRRRRVRPAGRRRCP